MIEDGFSQKVDLTINKGGEIPPQSYIKKLNKEADASLKIKVTGIHLDSCKTCTSTGVLYIIEGDILKKYFDKKKRIKKEHIYYMSASDTLLYAQSKEIIVFLNRIEKRDVEKFKSISWTARQATEFIFTPETESFIKKKPTK